MWNQNQNKPAVAQTANKASRCTSTSREKKILRIIQLALREEGGGPFSEQMKAPRVARCGDIDTLFTVRLSR